MKYNELNLTTNKQPKRVGRGIASGQGKTAGRGTKGQMARTGSTKRPGFEGGQNPIMQRLPKLRGFRSIRPQTLVVYTGQLNQFAGKIVDTTVLAKDGLVSSPYEFTKLIVKGDVNKKITVKLPAASAAAIKAVQAAGGSFEQVEKLPRPASENTRKRK
jgi:large subunit ribosomal protein L15